MDVQVPAWLTGAIAWWIYSAAVQAMPDPEPTSHKFYRFLYQFLHLLAANIGLIRKVQREEK